MPILVKLPKWGLTMESATVTEWLCAEGDKVRAGDPLFVAETDKATHDVTAPSDGVVRRLVAAEGANVVVSAPVAVLTEPGEILTDGEVDEFLAAQAPRASRLPAARGTTSREGRSPRLAAQDQQGRVRASPAARKLAESLGLDLQMITATGPGGRITSEDVERAAQTGTETSIRQDWVRLADGRRIFYVLAGQPGACPLVFIHGLGGSSSTWETVLGTFAESHQVLALDLPGHGQSDATDPAVVDYSLSGLAGVVRELVRSLGLSSVTLVGHSLGGAVAAQAALEEPNVVTRLVLVDSAGIGDEINPLLIELITGEPSAEASRDLLSLFFHDDRFVLDSGVVEHHQARLRPGADAAIRAVATGAFDALSQRSRVQVAGLSQPVLIVWGGEDRVIPATHAGIAEAAIPAATVVIIPGAGHVPQIETAEAFTEAVEQFLAETAS
jgi:pyruvate dehydrogenase E2 component (dihydrolipoamide acetyltransferase)